MPEMPTDTLDSAPAADEQSLPSEGPSQDGGETRDRSSDSDRTADRHVPLSALLAERRHYRAQMEELRRELDALKNSTAQQSSTQRPATEEDTIRQQWREFLRLNQLEEKLSSYDKSHQELLSNLQAINQAIQQMAPLIEGGQLALSMYFDKVRDYALQSYQPTFPISKEAYERLIAAEMSDEEVAAIRSGDLHAVDKVVDRVKKALSGSGQQRAAQEAARLRNLPRPPAPGGVPAEKEPQEPKTMKELHEAAWNTFQQALKRHGE